MIVVVAVVVVVVAVVVVVLLVLMLVVVVLVIAVVVVGLHRACYEAVDTTLRDVKRNDCIPFGCIPILSSGYFKQILPVEKHGKRQGWRGGTNQTLLNQPLFTSFCRLCTLRRTE